MQQLKYNSSMSSDRQSSSWKKIKGPKKQRDYKCGCGKSYLSNPALYTHIKNIHNGQPPGQVIKPETIPRGRPRLSMGEKPFDSQCQKINIDPVIQFIDIAANIAISASLDSVQEIYKKEPVYQLLIKFVDSKRQPTFQKDDNIFDVKIGEGTCQFLKQVQKQIGQAYNAFYDELVLLFTLFVSYIIEETQDQNVIANGSISLMPHYVNFFVLYDLKKHIERLKLGKLCIIRNQILMPSLSIFFKWIYYKQYTQSIVKINEGYNQSKQKSVSSLEEIPIGKQINEQKQDNFEDD